MPRPAISARSPLAAGALALTLVLGACGSGGEESADTTAADDSTAATDAVTDTTAAADTEETTADTGAAATEETTAAAPADGLAVELVEWEIVLGGDVAAGPVTFAVANTGENPHALAIARGDSYETLPQLDNGAVDTSTLGADYLTATDNIEAGATGTLSVDLEPGNYVFFCPIAFGPNSHARAGQVLSVTVS